MDSQLTSLETYEYFANSLAFLADLWQSIFCVGERPDDKQNAKLDA
jgi:hypothetical protein